MAGKRILMLATDAHGGFGGISQFNRDFCRALSRISEIGEVEVLVRLASGEIGDLPVQVRLNTSGVGSVRRYVLAALRSGLFAPRPDLVFCAHIHLLPLAWAIARLRRAPLVLQVHGIDAWRPTASAIANRLVSACDLVVSVSRVTLERLAAWADLSGVRCEILPNTVEPAAPAGAPRVTRKSLGIEGRKVLMSLGRMVGRERAKGFDEVIELLPRLARQVPDICYIAAGDGPDRERLQRKAIELGVGDRVIFPGRIPDAQKGDYYRIADGFVMASRGEGFGIVLLEAMAHGTPVLASRNDGGSEAVLGGALGVVADPDNADQLLCALAEVLRRPRGVPGGLQYFSFENFAARVAAILARQGVVTVAS